MVATRVGRLRLLSTRSTTGSATPEPILLVSTRSAMDCAQECVHLCVGFNPDGIFSRDTGTTGAVSRTTRAPTAFATGAPRDLDPNDSGLRIPGSPRDRKVRTRGWFEPGVQVHAHLCKRSNSTGSN